MKPHSQNCNMLNIPVMIPSMTNSDFFRPNWGNKNLSGCFYFASLQLKSCTASLSEWKPITIKATADH